MASVTPLSTMEQAMWYLNLRSPAKRFLGEFEATNMIVWVKLQNFFEQVTMKPSPNRDCSLVVSWSRYGAIAAFFL